MAGNLPMINAIFYDTAYAALVQGVLLPPHPGCPFRPLEDIGNIDNGEASFLVRWRTGRLFLGVFAPDQRTAGKERVLFLLSMGIDEVQTKRRNQPLSITSPSVAGKLRLSVPSRRATLLNRYSLANAFYLFAQLGYTWKPIFPTEASTYIGIKRVAQG